MTPLSAPLLDYIKMLGEMEPHLALLGKNPERHKIGDQLANALDFKATILPGDNKGKYKVEVRVDLPLEIPITVRDGDSTALVTGSRSMKIPDDDYEEFKQGMLSMSASSFTRSFLQALSMRQPSGLDKVTCPVLFVAGQKEPKAVNQSNAMLAKMMPNAQRRMAPGMSHGWLAEAPELHCRMVESWINDWPLPKELVE